MKIVTLMLAGAVALASNGHPAEQQSDNARTVLERNVASAIAATPGLLVKIVNEPEHRVTSAQTSRCHTRFRADGVWYDFDWSTPSGGPVRAQRTSFSGFVDGKLGGIRIPDQAGDGDRQRFDALFRAINAYWEHCNPGAADEDDW